jgi:hypothetical protein
MILYSILNVSYMNSLFSVVYWIIPIIWNTLILIAVKNGIPIIYNLLKIKNEFSSKLYYFL